MLKAVIFDMDGVIVDTEPIHAKAAIITAANFGISTDTDFCYQYIGSTTRKLFEDLVILKDALVSVEDLLQEYSKTRKQIIQEEGYPIISGVKDLIIQLYKQGMKLAIASSSPKHDIQQIVKSLGIQKYFDKLISGAELPNPKPAPDIFLQTLKELGVKKEEVVIIEDSENGCIAARAANIACIGFINPNSGHQNLDSASVLCESLNGLDFTYIEHVLKRYNGEPITIAHTKRLVIRELTVHDIKDMYQIYQNEEVKQYIDDMEEYLEVELVKHKAYIRNVYGFYGYGLWGVFNRDGSALIGRCGIQNNIIDGKEEIELSYLLDVNHWGMGYALECTRAVLSYAAQELEINRIVAVIDKYNTRSIKVAQRIGMSFEKEIEYHDRKCYLYSITDILETMKRTKASELTKNKLDTTLDSLYEKKFNKNHS